MTAALGITVRTGCGVVVVLRGTRRTPEIVLRHEIQLADPWVPESRHPYHHELRDHGLAGVRARRRGCTAARVAAHRAIRTFVREMRSHAFAPRGATVVVARLVDPARIRGAHARAHAEEARLYVEVVEASLRQSGLRTTTLVERDLRPAALERLRMTTPQIAAALRRFSHTVGTPWRSPEKHAALAAWIGLP
jgi:hypothetical protein